MSATEYLIDAATRHQVFLQRYAGSQSKEAVKSLNRLRRDLLGRLAQEPTNWQRARISAILADIESMAQTAFGDMWIAYRASATKQAQMEAGFSVGLYNKSSRVDFAMPSDQALINAIEGVPMSAPAGPASISLADSFKAYGMRKTAQITQIIRDGIALGDTVPVTSSKLSSIMSTLQRRQLDTLVRTATNNLSSVARTETMRANADLIESYRWVATLDGSTTFICASRDGQTYNVGTGPMPPAHWGCRSTTVPVIKPEFSVPGIRGKRPSIGAGGAKQVSSRTTYGGWLKKQPREFIDEALGPERSRLFRSGKLSIDQFVDPTGRVYTLDQLQSMHNMALQEI